jgi:hypothetical protein
LARSFAIACEEELKKLILSDETTSSSSGTEEKELLMLELLTYELVLFLNMAGIGKIVTNG